MILPEIDAMSGPSIRPWAGALAALVVLLVTQQALPLAAAQQKPLPGAETQPILQGIVVYESTGQPIESATVSLVGTDIEMQTGRYGSFAFPEVQFGRMSVRVTAPGHPSVTQEVDITGDRVVFLQFRLPSLSAVLSELLVRVRHDRANISVSDPRTAEDLLAREVLGVVGRGSANVGKNDYGIILRGTGSLTQSLMPSIFIDGVVVSSPEEGLDVLSRIPASDVLDIEVLRGPAAAFLYPFAANGVVLVTTRSGAGR